MKRYLPIALMTLFCVFTQATATPVFGKRLQVQLQGGTAAEQKNITTVLRLDKNQYLPNRFSGREQVQLAINAMQANVKLALQPYGYFSPTIHHTLRRIKGGWACLFHIKLGQPVRYHKITLTVDRQALPKNALAKLQKDWPLKKGERFTTASYDSAKTLLDSLANTYGFFSYRFKRTKLLINPRTRQANVTIDFVFGPRYRIGQTTFNAPDFKYRFLHRFLLYKVNAPYSEIKINKTRTGMINSHYFSSVNMVIKPNKKNKTVSIKANLNGRPPESYAVGAGYGTDTGPRGLLSATFNNIDGEGQSVKLLARGSKISNTFSVGYLIPGHYPANDHWAISAGINKLDEIAGQSFSQRVIGSYNTKRGNWSLSAELNALNERYNLTNLPKTNTTLFYPKLTVQYLTLDNPLFPHEGIGISTSVAGASQALFSKNSFMQYNLSVHAVTTPCKWLRALFRSRIAYTEVNNIQEIPLSLQPMAGGVNSIRGYSFNSIYNGKELFTASVELQLRLAKNWYLAGFYDTGNVSNNLFKKKLKVGIGPAIMWVSPVGPVELSVARAVSEPKKSWKIQISMGTAL